MFLVDTAGKGAYKSCMAQNASPISLASYNAATLQSMAAPASPVPSIFGVQIGPDTSGSFAMSVSGLAIQRSDGRWVAKPNGDDLSLFDVTDFLLPGINPMAYFLPAERLNCGDLIVISNDPLTLRYVVALDGDGEIEVLDPDTGDVTEFVPIQTPLFNCFIRVVSLADFFPVGASGETMEGGCGLDFPTFGLGKRDASMDEPRERFEMNEILMFLLLSQGSPGTNILPLLLLTGMQCGESNLLPILALSGALPQLVAPTAVTTTTTPPGTTPQPAANSALLAALALGGGFGFGKSSRRRDRNTRIEIEEDIEVPTPASRGRSTRRKEEPPTS